MITKILSGIGFTEEEARTYLVLLDQGTDTAANIARTIGMPRPSVYGFLKRLCEKGAVAESVKSGVKRFTAEPPEKLHLLFEHAEDQLHKQHSRFIELLPDLQKQHSVKLIHPKFQFFEGEEGVKHVLKDMLLYRGIETEAFWPIQSMIEMLSPDFFRYHNKARIQRNISIRAIWPQKQTVDIKEYPYLGVGTPFKREIRIAPKEVDFSMGYWLYASKAAFLSSRKERFGFIIESAELAETLRSQFAAIWKLSKPLTVDPKDTELFLKELR